jgi:hypothetical protein
MRNLGSFPAKRPVFLVSMLIMVAALCLARCAPGGRNLLSQNVLGKISQRIFPSGAPPEPPGQWGLAEMGAGAGMGVGSLTARQKIETDRLLSLGYTSGVQPRPRQTGVTFHVPELFAPGLLFFVSGHSPEALLMSREGEILHRWHCDYRELQATNPTAFLPQQPNGATGCWRRAHLFPNGDILAIFEGHGLVKLDRDSRLLWAYPGHCHHDLHVDEDGRIWVLTREAGLSPRLGGDEPVLLDYFTVLSPQGQVERRISLLTALENSPYSWLLDRTPAGGDVFHTNTLERLDGSLERLSPVFRKGNILTSIRELNAIAILDPAQERIVWALTGSWVRQHQPTLLPSGRILLFDNLGNQGRSRVLEIEPFTQEIVWSYGDTPDHSLFSRTCGASQRLPNGNTLIVESDNGRALEVTPNGQLAWEYRNQQRAGANDELIAAILDMVALPEGFPVDWLRGTEVAEGSK